MNLVPYGIEILHYPDKHYLDAREIDSLDTFDNEKKNRLHSGWWFCL